MRQKGERLSARSVAAAAIFTAVTCVFTLLVRVPIAPTRGYINLADVGVYFTALALGPWVGAFAGGVGTALADAIAGYPQWMLFSLLIHGCQGLVAGYTGHNRSFPWMLLGWIAGTIIMVSGYFGAGSWLYGAGAALVEVPGNLLQNIAGGVIGIPLVYAVRKAYPPLAEFGKGRTWSE